MPVRMALGFPTIFNLLGPLTNPAGALRQVMGVYEPRFLQPIAGALGALGAIRAMVIHSDDGLEGRLVSMHTFAESWDMWEMHPKGSEVVLCTAGSITLLQETTEGSVTQVTLGPGQYAINEPGVWHTAAVDG